MENSTAQGSQSAPNGTAEIGTNERNKSTPTGSQTPTGINKSSGGGQDPNSPSAIKEAAAEAKRRLKIDDQEVDEEEVIKVYRDRKGHQRAANRELQEGRAARKQAEEFISMMKDKGQLIPVLEKLGYKREDLKKLSEKYLAGVLEEEMLDPRERALREAQMKLKNYEELEKKQKEEIQKRREAELKKKYADDYTKEFVDALKTTGLPPTKPMVAEMAKYIHRASKIGFEMTAAEAAKLVKEDIENSFKSLYGESDAETLARLLGEQGLQKVRTYDTSRLKDPTAQLQTPKEQGEITRRREPGKRMTNEEWRLFNRK